MPDSRPQYKIDKQRDDHNRFMGEIADYLAKVRRGRSVVRPNPDAQRFSQPADDNRTAERMGLNVPNVPPPYEAPRGKDPMHYGFKPSALASKSDRADASHENIQRAARTEQETSQRAYRNFERMDMTDPMVHDVERLLPTQGPVTYDTGGPQYESGGIPMRSVPPGVLNLLRWSSKEGATPNYGFTNSYKPHPTAEAFGYIADHLMDPRVGMAFPGIGGTMRFGRFFRPVHEMGGFKPSQEEINKALGYTQHDVPLKDFISDVRGMNKDVARWESPDPIVRKQAQERYLGYSDYNQKLMDKTWAGREELKREVNNPSHN